LVVDEADFLAVLQEAKIKTAMPVIRNLFFIIDGN